MPVILGFMKLAFFVKLGNVSKKQFVTLNRIHASMTKLFSKLIPKLPSFSFVFRFRCMLLLYTFSIQTDNTGIPFKLTRRLITLLD